MSFLSVTRHSEWYEPKLIPLLGMGYLVIYLNHLPFLPAAVHLFFLIFSIMVGAIYVSVINDICDAKEDAAAGKANRLQGLSEVQKAALLILLISSGIACGYFIWPDKLSVLLYALSWIVFSLYSVYPFRFKARGILGVLCDASGAHLFPTLLIICCMMHNAGQPIRMQWTAVAGIWAFCYGLRGILWHQFYDRDNDIAAGINTFASKIVPQNFKVAGQLIFAVELVCFALIVYQAVNIWLLIAGLLYFLLMMVRQRRSAIYPVIIVTPPNRRFSIWMHDFYLVFFPLVILLDIALPMPRGWFLIAIHVLVFPRPVYRLTKDFLRLVQFKPL